MKWFGLGVPAAGSLWDERAVYDLSDRMVRTARALGALTILPVALAFLAISNWLTGRFGDAGEQWAEMRELLAESNLPRILGVDSRGHGLLLEYRGHLTEARALASPPGPRVRPRWTPGQPRRRPVHSRWMTYRR